MTLVAVAEVTRRLPGCEGAVVSAARAVAVVLETVALTVLVASEGAGVGERAHLEGVATVGDGGGGPEAGGVAEREH